MTHHKPSVCRRQRCHALPVERELAMRLAWCLFELRHDSATANRCEHPGKARGAAPKYLADVKIGHSAYRQIPRPRDRIPCLQVVEAPECRVPRYREGSVTVQRVGSIV